MHVNILYILYAHDIFLRFQRECLLTLYHPLAGHTFVEGGRGYECTPDDHTFPWLIRRRFYMVFSCIFVWSCSDSLFLSPPPVTLALKSCKTHVYDDFAPNTLGGRIPSIHRRIPSIPARIPSIARRLHSIVRRLNSISRRIPSIIADYPQLISR